MSDSHGESFAADPTRDSRPLPTRPNLEHERKEAKALLRLLRQGDAHAVKRSAARNTIVRDAAPRAFRLADAQLTIAREYGFASWPKLVSYFEALTRQERSGPQIPYAPEHYETLPDRILTGHRDRQLWAGQTLAAFIPRLYGKTPAETFDETITLDEARLAVARRQRFPSWDAFAERMRATPKRARSVWETRTEPLALASPIISSGDIDRLAQHVADHPELLGPGAFEEGGSGLRMLRTALRAEDSDSRRELLEAVPGLSLEDLGPFPDPRAVTSWILSRDDSKHALDRLLLGQFRETVADVERLLRYGANPRWLPPNGITVIEHAIVRYGNGAAVDRIAREVTPPAAFWIAAGLGDVAAVSRYLRSDGTLIRTARLRRPDLTAIGPTPRPQLPDANDMELIWEAFYVAGINERMDVLDLLLDRGFPVDYTGSGMPLLRDAVMYENVALVEYLIGHGADPTVQGWAPGQSAREIAERRHTPSSRASSHSEGPLRMREQANAERRILELVGGAERIVPPKPTDAERSIDQHELMHRIVASAKEDASRLGQKAVEPHNLFVAVLREPPPMLLAWLSGVDLLTRLRDTIAQRFPAGGDASVGDEIPLSAEAERLVSEALRAAQESENREDVVVHLVHLLTRDPAQPIDDLLGDNMRTTMLREMTRYALIRSREEHRK